MVLLSRKYAALTITLIYLVAGLLWIGLSDALLFTLADSFRWNIGTLEIIGMLKGYVYVVLTSVFLGFLIRSSIRSLISTKSDFKRLFAENPHPMWIYDTQTLKFLLVNAAACKAYGYTGQEFLQLTLHAIRPVEEHERLDSALAKRKEGYRISKGWVHRGRSGIPFYVNIFSHDTVYAGKACRIVTAININNERLAEMERDNLERALDNSALVSVTDLHGVILQANEKFCKVSGYREDELIGCNHNIINSGYHPPEFWKSMWQTVANGKAWRGDIRNKAKDGTLYWVDTIINPVYNSAGKMYKLMSVRYVVTERKKLEAEQLSLLKDLSDYAFQTSHELRGPVARMLGLVSLFNNYSDKDFIVEKIKETSVEIDSVITKMNKSLELNAYPIMRCREDSQERVLIELQNKMHR